MTTLILFAHGKESGPWGSKIRTLADMARRYGATVLSPDYSDLASPEDRVVRLLSLELPPHDRLILVGSSMGGYVSILASCVLEPAGLFVMAPAVYMTGYLDQHPRSGAAHTCVVFGRQDDVIPVSHGIRFADENHAELHVIEGDHRLTAALDRVADLFDAFLHQVGLVQRPPAITEWPVRQTAESLAAVVRPFIGRPIEHHLFARFDPYAPAGWIPTEEAIFDVCRPETDYGDLQISFRNGGDLTITLDAWREELGGPLIQTLRLADRSIPEIYAEEDRRRRDQRLNRESCLYLPLHWPQFAYGYGPTAVWVLEDTMGGPFSHRGGLLGIALRFADFEPGRERREDLNGPWWLGVELVPDDGEQRRQFWIRHDREGFASGWRCLVDNE